MKSILKTVALITGTIAIGLLVDRVFSKMPERHSVAEFLVVDFPMGTEQATSNLANKWIEVRGELQQIEVNDAGETVLFLSKTDEEKMIKCILRKGLSSEQIDELGFNKPIKIKGKYSYQSGKAFVKECEIF